MHQSTADEQLSSEQAGLDGESKLGDLRNVQDAPIDMISQQDDEQVEEADPRSSTDSAGSTTSLLPAPNANAGSSQAQYRTERPSFPTSMSRRNDGSISSNSTDVVGRIISTSAGCLGLDNRRDRDISTACGGGESSAKVAVRGVVSYVGRSFLDLAARVSNPPCDEDDGNRDST
jgi:hypothetical protein